MDTRVKSGILLCHKFNLVTYRGSNKFYEVIFYQLIFLQIFMKKLKQFTRLTFLSKAQVNEP